MWNTYIIYIVHSWYRGDKLVSTENSTELEIKEVSRENNLEDITCEVSNDVGTSRKITRLSVHCEYYRHYKIY